MYVKLALRNAKKSMKEYLIYMVTLIICVGLFYSFMSICSKYYVSSLPVEYDLKVFQKLMRYPVIGINALLIFLIKYVNNYILRRKQKEFAIQTLLGMEQKNAAFLFFVETLIMGLISVAVGIILGSFLSQILTLSIMNFFEEDYTMFFSLFPDTVFITFIGFLAAFILIGFLNIRKIRKMKIIDMLHADKVLQNDMKKEYLMPFLILVATVISVRRLFDGVHLYQVSKGLILSGKLGTFEVFSFFANIILPIIFIGIVATYIILCLILRKILSIQKLILVLTGITILIITFALLIVAGHPVLDSTSTNLSFLYALVYFIFFMFTLFYSLATLIKIFKEKSRRWKYQGNTLFLVGQICGRLSANSRTMSVIAVSILLAVTILIIEPILSGWAYGYVKERAVYDIQINTSNNSHTTIDTLPDGEFSYVDTSLEKMGIQLKDKLIVEMYYLNYNDYIEGSVDQPVMALSLSDYNHLRTMAGLNKISLKQNEFTTQWHFGATEELADEFLQKNSTLKVGNYVLNQADNMKYRAKLGEVIYPNMWYPVALIIPDQVCKGLLMGQCNYYANTVDKMSFEKAKVIDQNLYKDINQINKEKQYRTELRIRTLQRNEGISAALLMKLLLIYGGVILFVICYTILSLQQLVDSSDFKQRFRIIKKMGVSDSSINRIICGQMAIWFGLPIFFASISAIIMGMFYIRWTEVFINMLIGSKAFYESLFKMFMIIVILFVCYFVSTWVLFKKNIEAD